MKRDKEAIMNFYNSLRSGSLTYSRGTRGKFLPKMKGYVSKVPVKKKETTITVVPSDMDRS